MTKPDPKSAGMGALLAGLVAAAAFYLEADRSADRHAEAMRLQSLKLSTECAAEVEAAKPSGLIELPWLTPSN